MDAWLVVLRDGQRGGWFMLPHDSMGSVLDPNDAQPRLSALLRVIAGLSVPLAERYAIGIGAGPTTMLTIGNADVVGRRTSSSISFAATEKFIIEPDDSIGAQALTSRTDDIASELIARLISSFSR